VLARALPLLILALAALAPRVQAQPVTRITWVTADTNNPGRAAADANGMTGRLVDFLRPRWPQVEHEILIANAKRGWQMIEAGQQVCRANTVRTPEREKLAYFTNMQLTPPVQLIVRRDRVTLLPRNAAGEVVLPRLLADTRLRGALVDGRSYGTAVDEQLSDLARHKQVTLYSPKDFGGRLLQMLALDRADYAIDFDMALVMVDSTQALQALQSLPIQGASEPVMGAVACPRTPWGLAAIRGIDRAMGSPAGATMLRESLQRWLTPEARAHYGARMDAFYRERARPTAALQQR
jgi:uncharacterized protein (TIGR02285 family)